VVIHGSEGQVNLWTIAESGVRVDGDGMAAASKLQRNHPRLTRAHQPRDLFVSSCHPRNKIMMRLAGDGTLNIISPILIVCVHSSAREYVLFMTRY
jgi:hypothetical protein